MPILDAIQEAFEDVSLDYNSKPSKARFYGVNKPKSINSGSFLPSYSTSSLPNNSSKELLLTPSQKLKIIKKQRVQKSIDQLSTNSPENLNSIDFLSDDELPDNLIVFDVPSLYSLQSLSTNRSKPRKPSIRRKNSLSSSSSNETTITNTHNITKQIDNTTVNTSHIQQPPNWRHIHSLSTTNSSNYSSSTTSSPATRASSIFSKTSDISEYRYSKDDLLNPLSKEVRMLSQNKDVKLEETLQRMSMLKSMSHIQTQKILSGSNINQDPDSSIKLNYLSATRQSNLPPKTKDEIIKHEKDCQHLLELEIQNENEKLKEYQIKKKQSLIQYEKDERLWNTVINDYDILVRLPQTRELWWRNVPAKYRNKIWKKQLISTKKKIFTDDELRNSILQSSKIIDDACNYKLTKDELMKKQKEKEHPKIAENVGLIEKLSNQIQFSYPELQIFQNGETFDSILKILISFNNLKAKTERLINVDTFKLVNLVCILFHVLRDELSTLNCFISLISKKLPNVMLVSNDDEIPPTLLQCLELEKKSTSKTDAQISYLRDIKNQFDKYLLQLTPNLYNNFIQKDINSLKLIQGLTSCIFSNQLSFKITLRILDIYLFEGDIFLLRVSLALFKNNAFKLFGSRDEVFKLLKINIGENQPNSLDILNLGEVDDFIRDIRNVLKKGSKV